MLRACFFDVDRTLLTDDHVVPPAVRDALQRLQRCRVAVVLATARSRRGLDPVLAQIDRPDALICCNGAWVGERRAGDRGYETIAERPLDLSVARSAVRFSKHPRVLACWYTAEGWFVPARTAMVLHEIHVTGEAPTIVDLDGVSAPPQKLLLIAEHEAAIPTLAATAREVAGAASASFSHRNFLEITAPGVTKAAAMLILCTQLGIAADETAAIGDASNDVGMVAAAGIGIAMGNAVEEVKRAAAWTTASNQEAGVALAIDRLIRGG